MSYRPHRDLLVPSALLATLFLLLPITYAVDKGQGLTDLAGNWWMPILLLTGVGGIFGMIVAIFDRIGYEVTRTGVKLSIRTFPRGTQVRELPFSEYAALVTERGKEPSFLGMRENYQILLWHRSEPLMRIVLHAGADKSAFERRLQAYQLNFGLPIDPPGMG